jgi:hypothetical protein
MPVPVLLIVEETIQRAYTLDAENPDHADLIDRVMRNPLQGPQMFDPKPPALLGKRALKGARTPFIGLPHAKGGMQALDPDAQHAVNTMMTVLHLDERGKPFHQIKIKRTTAERGPVKS